MAEKDKHHAPAKPDSPMCGLVMPISAIDGCSSEHWAEVQAIISDAVKGIPDPKFSIRLVSTSDDIGVIQKRIVQNLYTDEIIVCDVSAKNPNVMFELGMRLAFDKPTVIVKDDKTTYSFDTSPIEHLDYPRDLRFTKIVQFKEQLATKVRGTYQASKNDPKHSTFLKHFGTFQVAKLSQETVSSDELILAQLAEMQAELLNVRGQLSKLDRFAGKAQISDEQFMRLMTKAALENPDFLSSRAGPDFLNYVARLQPFLNDGKPKGAKGDE
jgi:hypothetical protein